jgi:ankyrin repeat protein
MCEHKGIVQLLVKEFGADTEAADSEKSTALHIAASRGNESIVQLLVDTLHVNTEAKNEKGKTALDTAREM